jgi:hypothetical protein
LHAVRGGNDWLVQLAPNSLDAGQAQACEAHAMNIHKIACSYFGEAVKHGPSNHKDSAAACCQSCLDFRPATSEDAACNGALPLTLTAYTVTLYDACIGSYGVLQLA